MAPEKHSPKLFISYSWSSPDHEQWVMDLATNLMEAGVDVILDKWDLKEGHDAVAFMERMVTDSSIEKVAMISDKKYAEKADGRAAGVGTETQIISREVYEAQSQEKFVAVLPCRDEKGNPYLPTYYKGRIYIDLSRNEKFAEEFEKLLRWIYNKPLYVKPELGSQPAFLNEDEKTSLGTTAAFRRCINAITTSKPYASGATDEYFEIFSDNLDRFRIEVDEEVLIDDTIIQRIEEFLPYRNELNQVFNAIARYYPDSDYITKVHRFFEKVAIYMDRPPGRNTWNELELDNFKFVVHEMFLYCIAILIKYERFSFARDLLITPYYLAANSDYVENRTMDFRGFRRYAKVFAYRNDRLNLNRLSLRADMLKARSATSGLNFESLMQADFVLFLRDSLQPGGSNNWWPETLMYTAHAYSPFEIFARARSRRYFERMKCIIGVDVPDELNKLIELFDTDPASVPQWGFERLDPGILANSAALCTSE